MRQIFHVVVIIISIWAQPIRANTEAEDELEKHRALESFVELKGGEFFMGINDREEGVNGEHPQRKAIVSPFRLVSSIGLI